MPKRTFWMTAGVAVGVGSTLWAERKVRRTVEQAAARLQPDALVVEVGRSARLAVEGTGDRVRGAFSSGRAEMQRREEELWEDLASSGRLQGPRSQPWDVEPAEVAPPRRFGRRRAS